MGNEGQQGETQGGRLSMHAQVRSMIPATGPATRRLDMVEIGGMGRVLLAAHKDLGRIRRVKAKPLRGRFARLDRAAAAKGWQLRGG